MIMAQTLTRSLTLAALLTLPLAWGARASAQDAKTPKDDALDSLLKKVEEKPSKAAEKPAEGAAKKSSAAGKPSGEVAGKDKELDSLLEKLGATEDKAAPDEKRGGSGGEPKPGDPPPGEKGKDKDEQKKNDPNALSGKTKALDEHLEELTGKRRKKKRDEGEGSGPLSEVIKQMREVEQRLGKPDTGEDTRKKQTEIVKRIDTLIEQMRASQGQSKGKPRPGLALRPGQQPGPNQNGETPGTTGGNAPFTKPQKPTDRHSLAGGKETWGHLPPELRQEMENVFREEPLPSREELIRRYYLSVSKKALTRGE